MTRIMHIKVLSFIPNIEPFIEDFWIRNIESNKYKVGFFKLKTFNDVNTMLKEKKLILFEDFVSYCSKNL